MKNRKKIPWRVLKRIREKKRFACRETQANTGEGLSSLFQDYYSKDRGGRGSRRSRHLGGLEPSKRRKNIPCYLVFGEYGKKKKKEYKKSKVDARSHNLNNLVVVEKTAGN